MDKYNTSVWVILILGLVVAIAFTALMFTKSLALISLRSYKTILFPSYEPTSIEKNPLLSKKEKEQRQSSGLRNKFRNFTQKKGWDEKVKRLYIRAGFPNKTIENLFIDVLKFALVGALLAGMVYFFLGNIWIGLVLALLATSFPIINLIGDIQDRQNEFRRDFPYFLQTLSFVLANGSNMSIAFYDVVNKQQEGVLKEVMLDVITAERVNGGDFTNAFMSITDKIKIDEAKEFVEIVRNNLDKGVSVAETFQTQAETITRFIRNKKNKKVKGISNKILIPIMIVLLGLVLLFLH